MKTTKVIFSINDLIERAEKKLKKEIKNDCRILKDIVINNKEKVMMGVTTLCVLVIGTLSLINMMTVYEYSYEGKVLGMVKEQDEVIQTAEMAEKLLTQMHDAQIVIDKNNDLQFEKVVGVSEKVDDEKKVLSNLTAIEKVKATTYNIEADGEVLATLEDEETANRILDKVTKEAIGDDNPSQYLEIGFFEDVQVVKKENYLDEIIDEKKAYRKIITGGIEKKVHIVEGNETDYDIALEYGLTEDDLQEMNPDINTEIIHDGMELKLEKEVPLLNVKTVERDVYKEEYGPVKTYTHTDDLYKDDTVVTKKGKAGTRMTTVNIIKKNGIEVDKDELSYQVIKKQKSQEILKGTREIPEEIGKGYYTWPLHGRFSSKFGKRWGREHLGIDIANDVGTEVVAADGGKVIYAGLTDNGYGYMIQIDHGMDRMTMYAHNSKLLVKTGDTVYRGQHIAESGNTGYSTGPHLHFEVRIKGDPKNPLKYLDKNDNQGDSEGKTS